MSTPSSVARRTLATAAAAAATLAVFACANDATAPASPTSAPLLNRGGQAGTHLQYGTPTRVGNGHVRTYAVIDQKHGGRTLELGVALDEHAMDGLRGPDLTRGEEQDHDIFLLPVPERSATAFRFVEFDWNPRGHGAPYDLPHFDFHFYTISQAERAAILPSDPQWAAKAANEPPAAAVPQFYANPAALLGLPPAAVAVPMMGAHWIDVRSPELQPPTSPAYRPFTTTFIYGAWDGKLTFMEPMITRAYILAKRDAADPAVRDEVIPVPTSASYPAGTFRPDAYRIAYDAQAREYRIALTLAH